jgi:hypothetical protein
MDRIVGGDNRFVKPVIAAGFWAQTLSAKFLGNCLLVLHIGDYEEIYTSLRGARTQPIHNQVKSAVFITECYKQASLFWAFAPQTPKIPKIKLFRTQNKQV